jgi:hypothetical protein
VNNVNRPPPESRGLADGAAYCFAFRGLWSVAVIFYTNSSDLTWSDFLLMDDSGDSKNNNANYNNDDKVLLTVEEGISMKPHLNSALRAEILYFTTKGIIFSASEFYQMYPPNRKNRDAEYNENSNSFNGNDSRAIGHNNEHEEDLATRDSSFSFKEKLHLGYELPLTFSSQLEFYFRS